MIIYLDSWNGKTGITVRQNIHGIVNHKKTKATGEVITSRDERGPGASQPGADVQYSSLIYAGMTTFTGGGAKSVS